MPGLAAFLFLEGVHERVFDGLCWTLELLEFRARFGWSTSWAFSWTIHVFDQEKVTMSHNRIVVYRLVSTTDRVNPWRPGSESHLSEVWVQRVTPWHPPSTTINHPTNGGRPGALGPRPDYWMLRPRGPRSSEDVRPTWAVRLVRVWHRFEGSVVFSCRTV